MKLTFLSSFACHTVLFLFTIPTFIMSIYIVTKIDSHPLPPPFPSPPPPFPSPPPLPADTSTLCSGDMHVTFYDGGPNGDTSESINVTKTTRANEYTFDPDPGNGTATYDEVTRTLFISVNEILVYTSLPFPTVRQPRYMNIFMSNSFPSNMTNTKIECI